ncbi:protein kinase domain-containing protein, partial [Streptomyces lasiicapitis]|uniref:protein kinase domain-containing protein n=1 Tax=Streptomyces lasiicapitis TaxID=1923961 RepID=UPI003653C461
MDAANGGGRMRPAGLLEQRYQLGQLLGRGGFGEVWRSFDTRVRREVAVKIGRPRTPDEARRFAREARLVGNLSHPHIATLHDYGETEYAGEHVAYLVMELVPGAPLDKVIREGIPPFARSLTWAGQICAALAAAPDQGIGARGNKTAKGIITGPAAGRAKGRWFGGAKQLAPAAGP